ncbi:MAG TPA: MBL fold metallo-hydrolase [Polyangia bacterium]|nr:MBL fold metallo-hydrolase [Polyangia bacterium]
MNAPLMQVWGCRGGRNTRDSRIGNSTSSYSVAVGADLFVFDAGRGLGALGAALTSDERLRGVARLHVLITHAHMDHWEGLKDAEWMWRRDNGLELTVFGPHEALATIAAAHQPPGFVALDVLAMGTLARLSFVALTAGSKVTLPGATLETVALHHYSGVDPHRRHLDTLGYRLAIDGGPTVAYLSDHEPTAATRAMEDAVVAAAQLVIVDANHSDVAQHTFGHGSIEYAADLARRHPRTRVLAGHHGPLQTDRLIEDAFARHAAGCANVALAVEGAAETWDPVAARFVRQ